MVVTKHFPEQFEDLVYSYQNLILRRSNGSTMLAAFWDGFGETTADWVFCGSSDVAYQDSAVARAVSVLGHPNVDAVVGLKSGYAEGEKQWVWDVEKDVLRDIELGKQKTAFEKFFLIVRRAALVELRSELGSADGVDADLVHFEGRMGSGWIYLLKALAHSGRLVKVCWLDGEALQNVNRLTDLSLGADHTDERSIRAPNPAGAES